MRFLVLFTASTALVLLTACGGPESRQADKATANATLSQVALSQGDAAAIMHERHEGMETIGKANKAIKRELDASAPNLATVRSGAGTIANLSRKASRWFPAGTGPEVGKTGAKPEIWQDPRDFAAKLRNFQGAAQAFNAAASGNDAGAIKARFADMGGACKACHDKYRSEMHH